MSPADPRKVYPEIAFGGYSRYDGTIAFATRVRALLQPRQTVLDLGCGRGRRIDDRCTMRRHLQDLRGDGRRVIGIDPDVGAHENPFIDEFRLMNSTDPWPIESSSIDLVYCDYVLEHVEDPHRFFSELARVVKDGGHACFRTPNRWSYVAIVARLVPNRLHTRVTSWAQRKRKAQDVFPTAYRCNSRRALRRLLRSYGFVGVVFSMEGEPSYLEFSGLLYRAAALVQPFLPGFLRSTLHAFARRTTGSK